MEAIKFVADVFREFGPGNTALVVILGLFVLFFLKVVPRIAAVVSESMDKIVTAVEKLGTTFAVHDERSAILFQVVNTLLLEVQNLKSEFKSLRGSQISKEDLNRFHERIDRIQSNQITKDILGEHLEQIKKELERHSKVCERQNDRLCEVLKV